MYELKFVRIWSDSSMIEVQITYKNEFVSGKFTSYMNHKDIKRIASDLLNWKPILNETLQYSFNSNKGDGECLILFKQFNVNGHISISIEMENILNKETKGFIFSCNETAKTHYYLDSYKSHGSVVTDISSINTFGKQLLELFEYDYAEAILIS